MPEYITDERAEQIAALADEIRRAPSRFTKDFVVANLADGVADLSGVIDRLHTQMTERVAELERALADVDMTFRLSHGGGWCATCRWPMREGTPVVKTLAVVCEPCAVDLAATAGRLDPTRLAARKDAELGTEDATEDGQHG